MLQHERKQLSSISEPGSLRETGNEEKGWPNMVAVYSTTRRRGLDGLGLRGNPVKGLRGMERSFVSKEGYIRRTRRSEGDEFNVRAKAPE
ncbi:hypothetical protein PGQ11_003647 [Apiospora arundinis]|uniref:Uncharacterized protein n=1 Tax=Apiospora arundinis TaxID=335852 RepID=A0ABR2J5S7_9PEZI